MHLLLPSCLQAPQVLLQPPIPLAPIIQPTTCQEGPGIKAASRHVGSPGARHSPWCLEDAGAVGVVALDVGVEPGKGMREKGQGLGQCLDTKGVWSQIKKAFHGQSQGHGLE
jgi:hypothetical protein